jgi:fucose permease
MSGWGWNIGYRSVAGIQIVLAIILFISLPLWKRKSIAHDSSKPIAVISLWQTLKIKGVKFILLTFFSYCALESTAGLWASSYLVQYRGVDVETAAKFASLFFLGITFGRFLCGFVTERVGDRLLVRFGIIIIIIGIFLIGLPAKANTLALLGLIIIGFGCAPVYPSIIHSTPSNFGAENSQAIIGIQMASAYMGSTFMPPLFGVIADHINIGVYPFYLIFFAILMLLMSERLSRTIAKSKG